jgi:hypothetical protein
MIIVVLGATLEENWIIPYRRNEQRYKPVKPGSSLNVFITAIGVLARGPA